LEFRVYSAQNAYIAGCVNVYSKRNKTRVSNRIEYSGKYKFNDQEICRRAFIDTLQISTKRVNTVMNKKVTCAKQYRQRKKPSSRKLHTIRKQDVIDHINLFPQYSSHYSREQTNAEFLNPELTLAKMYDIYSDGSSNTVTLSTYKQIYTETLIYGLRLKRKILVKLAILSML